MYMHALCYIHMGVAHVVHMWFTCGSHACTSAKESKRANSSLSVVTSVCADTFAERLVKPLMSANRILQEVRGGGASDILQEVRGGGASDILQEVRGGGASDILSGGGASDMLQGGASDMLQEVRGGGASNMLQEVGGASYMYGNRLHGSRARVTCTVMKSFMVGIHGYSIPDM